MAVGTTPGKRSVLYCDDCGFELDPAECVGRDHGEFDLSGEQRCDDWCHAVASLPSDIEHAKAGEAAVLCGPCYRWLFPK
jgi:hypothetical protein